MYLRTFAHRAIPILPLFVLSLYLQVFTALANEDFSCQRSIGNLKVRVTSGFRYEEVRKAWLVGSLASQLLTSLHYRDTVILDFVHAYGLPVRPEYFLSIGDGSVGPPGSWRWYGHEAMTTDSTAIIVRHSANSFDVEGVLKLLEYGVLNYATLKSHLTATTLRHGIGRVPISSIDTATTREIANASASPTVKLILQVESPRPDEADFNSQSTGYSYYWQNGKYKIFLRRLEDVSLDTVASYQWRDTVILTLTHIYQFERGPWGAALVFDTDSTFCYLSQLDGLRTPRHFRLRAKKRWLEPFEIDWIGFETIAISYGIYTGKGFQHDYRTMIYQPRKRRLIQDLDRFLDSHAQPRGAP